MNINSKQSGYPVSLRQKNREMAEHSGWWAQHLEYDE